MGFEVLGLFICLLGLGVDPEIFRGSEVQQVTVDGAVDLTAGSG